MQVLSSSLLVILFCNYWHPFSTSDVIVPKFGGHERMSPALYPGIIREQANYFEMSSSSWTEKDLIPIVRYSKSEFHCVKDRYMLLCIKADNNIRVRYSYIRNYLFESYIKLECEDLISSSPIQYDYSSILNLKEDSRHVVISENCPLPSGPYASLFPLRVPSADPRSDSSAVLTSNVKFLDIYCQQSQNFSLAKRHLEGLTRLIYLAIRCETLTELPEDLFRETTPEIEVIRIYDTALQSIPEGLFRDQEKLEMVYLHGNAIESIPSDLFAGCLALKVLRFDRNRLNDFFGRSPVSVEQLNLAGNELSDFPKGFHSIETLNFARNRLTRVETEDCVAFAKMRLLDLSSNRITSIDSKCFSLMTELIYLDISGNSLSRITEKPAVLEKLVYFFFNDNSRQLSRVEKFFVGQSVLIFQMRNSNVISLEEDVLDGFPNLMIVDLSANSIAYIPANFFFNNKLLRVINLRGNKISRILPSLFESNAMLYDLDLSSNNLESFPPRNGLGEGVDRSSSDIYRVIRRIHGNLLTDFISFETNPQAKFNLHKQLTKGEQEFLSGVISIRVLNVSSNRIGYLDSNIFLTLDKLQKIDLGYNLLRKLPEDTFYPLRNGSSLEELHLQGNRLSSLPDLELPNLKYLDLSKNALQSVPVGAFYKLPRLRYLDVSMNNITDISNRTIVEPQQSLHSLDLSFNQLRGIPNDMLIGAKALSLLNLSHNKIEDICLEFIPQGSILGHLNVSNNRVRSISCSLNYRFWKYSSYLYNNASTPNSYLKVLDLSSNNIDLRKTKKLIEVDSMTWGSISPFTRFANLEVLILSNNSIKEVFLDWRVFMPRLQLVDLRYNKIQYLFYQDLLFSTTSNYENYGFGPLSCSRNITLDLRHNQIRGIELPKNMLEKMPEKNESKGFYGQANIMIDDNPYVCGCQVLDLLRILHFDVALRSDLYLYKSEKWILPAKLDAGNLSCSTPATIRGKRLNAEEEWIHHLLPMIGICSLEETLMSGWEKNNRNN